MPASPLTTASHGSLSPTAKPHSDRKGNPDMITKIRRLALLLATSSGIIAATTATAHAGMFVNHCEPRLLR
jgi:hypothetical protein